MHRYMTLRKLRAGEAIDFEGVLLELADGDIKPGDTYIAERNTGPHLLTARSINTEGGWIVPTEIAYPFDTRECVKIRFVEE